MHNGSRALNVFAPPDAAALEVGAGGERFAAKTRLAFFAVVWLIPAVLIFDKTRTEIPASFIAATVAVLVSAFFVFAIRRGWSLRAMPFVTSAFDVTIVSVTLVAFALIGRPHLAVNSMVVWEIYLLAILSTALRFDVRVSLFAGALAIVQYVAILAWVTSTWDVREPDALNLIGRLSWSTQVARVVLMFASVVLAIGIVVRSRRFMFLSGTDQLTGLPNRTYFAERLRQELARARRSGHTLAVAMLDLDRFKKLNDEWGHDVGDAALQVVADVLRSGIHAADLLARWGGEELIVVFVDTDAAGARANLDRMRADLAGRRVPGANETLRVTFSAGVAQHPIDGMTEEALISVADRRLLEAKAGGRDRVVG